MALKNASDVARRSLCLELLLQRLGLELDEDPEEERNVVRLAWLARVPDLGLDKVLLPDERAFLETPVDGLNEEQTEDMEGRVICALAILWSLGRIGERPSGKMLGDATRLLTEYGVLGDGSIPAANKMADGAKLRPEKDLRDALAGYREKRSDTTAEPDDDQMVAALSATTLAWILGEASEASEASGP